MRDTRKTLKYKLLIVAEAEECGSIRATALKYKIQPSQIRNWRRNKLRFCEAIKGNPQAKSIIERKLFKKPDVEKEVLIWAKELKSIGSIITTGQIIIKSLLIDPGFLNGNKTTLRKWVNAFVEKHKLYQGQTLSFHLEKTKNDFVCDINERFKPGGTLSDVDDSMFVSVDEIFVYNSKRMTVCVASAYDGTKLPLFFVFKGKPGGTIEKSIDEEFGNNVFGCCQEKGMMDKRANKLWIEKIWKPYVNDKNASFLLLDEFQYHKRDLTELNSLGTQVDFIPGSHTSVFDSNDIGINKQLMKKYDELYMKWSNDELIKPSRKDEVIFMVNAWQKVSVIAITNAYKTMGYETKKQYDVKELIEEVMELCI